MSEENVVDEVLIEAVVKKVLEEQKVGNQLCSPTLDAVQIHAQTVQCLTDAYGRLNSYWGKSEVLEKARSAIGAILKELL